MENSQVAMSPIDKCVDVEIHRNDVLEIEEMQLSQVGGGFADPIFA